MFLIKQILQVVQKTILAETSNEKLNCNGVSVSFIY